MAAHICCAVWFYPFLMSQSEASHSHVPVRYEINISYVLWKLALSKANHMHHSNKQIQNVNSEKCFPQHTVKFNHNNSCRQTLQMYQTQNTDFLTAGVDCTLRSLSHYLLKDRGRVRPLGRGRMCHHRRHVWGCFLRRCYHLEASRASTVTTLSLKKNHNSHHPEKTVHNWSTLSATIPVRHALMFLSFFA